MTLKTCPDRHALERLLLGDLPAVEREALDEHLLHCDQCVETAETITASDDLTDALRARRVLEFDQQAIAEVIERGKQLRAMGETVEVNETIAAQSLPLASEVDGPSYEEQIAFLAPAQEPGELGRLGEYRVLEVLGMGGMGIVFRAEDPRLERQVALKAMKPEVATSRSAKDRFLREARATAAIEHDNIVPIYQVGEDCGVPFIAMQFLRGESLADRLKRESRLSPLEVVKIGREVADGLEAAHRRGLVHRDIKPDNIWIEEDTGRVKIVDFGLVRNADIDTNLTQAGMVMGTPRYMAPEQAQGQVVDHRCDLFSLGSVLYRIASGKLPFEGGNLTAMLLAVAHADPKPLGEVSKEVDPDLAALITRLLSKDRDARPQSAAEVSRQLVAIERKMGNFGSATTGSFPMPTIGPKLPTIVKEPTLRTTPHPRQKMGASRGNGRAKLIAAGLGGALVLLAAIVIFFQTPDGTLRVEILDPKVELSVQGTELLLKGVDTKDISVTPGNLTLHVKRDDFEFDTKTLVLEKGETVVVRVELLDGALQVVSNGQVIGSMRPDVAPAAMATARSNAAAPVVAATSWQPTKEQQDFFDQVVKLPVEEQIVAVKKKMGEVNPGFDAKRFSTRNEGVDVVSVGSGRGSLGQLETLWPIRAWPHLQNVEISATALADLSPLAGLSLTTFALTETEISDFGPLAGMPLKSLKIHGNKKIRDLRPLRGMQLTAFSCTYSTLRDLSDLQGMPLTELACESTPINDLTPLTGMPLVNLYCSRTQVADLTPLQGMPLKTVEIGGTKVRDLSPLAGMPLVTLEASSTLITDVKPLAQTRLQRLNISGTSVTDLGPLTGLPLTSLDIASTLVTDLEPLSGLPLTHLDIASTRVTDLSPLVGTPIKQLQMEHTAISDISLLRGRTLDYIYVDLPLFYEPDEKLVRSLPLKQLMGYYGDATPEKFFKGYTARKEAAEAFASATSKLPAEEQLKAITSRFQELKQAAVGFNPVIEAGTIVEVTLTLNDKVVDITPLRALTGLKKLTIKGGPYWLDLSPLNATQLESLTCRDLMARRNTIILKSIPTLTKIDAQPE